MLLSSPATSDCAEVADFDLRAVVGDKEVGWAVVGKIDLQMQKAAS